MSATITADAFDFDAANAPAERVIEEGGGFFASLALCFLLGTTMWAATAWMVYKICTS